MPFKSSLLAILLSIGCVMPLTLSTTALAQDTETNPEEISLRETANRLKAGGAIFRRLENYQEALSYYLQALSVYRKLGDRENEGTICKYLGDLYSRIGNYQEAIDYGLEYLKIAKEVGDVVSEASALSDLGNLSLRLGKHQEAMDYHDRAFKIFRKTDRIIGQANSLTDLGNTSHLLGDNLAAKNYLQQALQIYRQQNKLDAQASPLMSLGNVAASQNQNQEAIGYYEQALQIARQMRYQIVESAALNNLGNVSRKLGRHQEAIAYQQKSLDISRKIGNKGGEASILANIGISEYRQRRLSVAIDHLQRASDLSDTLRQNLSDADRVALFETQLYYYKLLAAARLLERDFAGSLIATERGRARIFTELLSKRLSNRSNLPQSSGLTFEQIQAQAISRKATIVSYSIQKNHDIESPLKPYENPDKLLIHVINPSGQLTVKESPIPKGLELTQTVENNRAELRAAADRVTRSSRSIQSRGMSPARIKVGMFVRLEDDPPETRRKVIKIDAKKKLVTLQAPNPTAANDVVELSQLILATTAPTPKVTELRQLHKLLIEPIASLLPSDPQSPVIFIPDGTLYEVPFAALKNERGQYLIDLHTISIAPSLSVLAQTAKLKQRKFPVNRPSLVVGNPDFKGRYKQLPASENEARDIAKLFPSRLLIGSEATESAVTQSLPSARIAHFATHGFRNNRNGMFSHILLTPQEYSPNDFGLGALTAENILNLKLDADLVVLSACDTGLGKITGDSVIGLSRSFIAAGANSIIVSMWSVDDKATAVLMTDFYREWQGGKSKAQALRAAMLNTKAKYPDPYYWSSMSLYGEID